MLGSPHGADISPLLYCFKMDLKILKANCLHNGCFQKYRRVGRHADRGLGGAPRPWARASLFLAAHSPRWTSHTGRGVRRAVRQLSVRHLILFSLHPSYYTAHRATQNTEHPPLTILHSSLCLIFPLSSSPTALVKIIFPPLLSSSSPLIF